MPRAATDPLVQQAMRVFENLFVEFPEMRLFSRIAADVVCDLYNHYVGMGVSGLETLAMMAAPSGSIAIAGSVYVRTNGRYVGTDAESAKFVAVRAR